MKNSIVITPHVYNTINSLPVEERVAVVSALAGELLLGQHVNGELSPMENVVYHIIRDYIRRDSLKMSSAV